MDLRRVFQSPKTPENSLFERFSQIALHPTKNVTVAPDFQLVMAVGGISWLSDCSLKMRMNRLTPIFDLAIVLLTLTAWPTFAAIAPPSKPEAMAFLNSVKEQNLARLRETDQSISKNSVLERPNRK